MTIEDFEAEIMGIFGDNISYKEKERMRWFIIKVKGEYCEKRVSVTSCILDDRFQMHTMIVAVKKNYKEAFLEVIEKLKERFGDEK